MVIIKECHVENFGKITNFDFQFEKGLNIINEDNSWGKTTFSAFIKSMFYGLEYNSKRKNERKQYEPWQGGVFGGSMTLDINGREYKIERTFGKKDKDDTFALYDLKTGKPSDDYTEKIGEELFEIDRESFAKSIYVPQCSTDTEMTDSINAKIGNLASAKDDINNYEVVVKMLENKKKEYSGKGKKTKNSELISEISDLKAKLEMRKELENEVRLLKQYIYDKEQSLKSVRQEREKCNQVYLDHSRKIADTAIYRELQNNLQETEKRISNIRGKYKKEIDVEDIEILKSESEIISNLRSQMEFINGNGIGNDAKSVPSKERFEELKQFFSERNPSKEEILEQIDNYKKAEQLQKEIISCEAEMYGKSTKMSPKFIGFLFAGIGIAALGVGLEFFNVIIGTILIITGIVFAMIGIFTANTEKKQKSDDIKNRTEMMKAKAGEYENAYMEFVSHFKIRYQENVINVLMEIKEKKDEYDELSYSLDENRKQKEAIDYRIAGHIKKYNDLILSYSDRNDLNEHILKNDYNDMEREKQNAATLQSKLEMLKDSVNAETGEVLSADELNEKLETMDGQIHVIMEDLNMHKRDLEKKYESLEENEFLEEELEKKQEELSECRDKAKIIEGTLFYLNKAKEQFSERYLGPMRETFSSYVKMINGIENANIKEEDLEIDIDLNVKYNYGSMGKDRDSLSRGYRDLVDLCLRLSLVEVMFKHESPVLILDDPFVNLDETKIENALQIVKSISENYQVIYFTCHRSRC